MSWDGSQFVWNSGAYMNYKDWAYREPSSAGIYVVVSAYHGKWRNVASILNRGLKERYICKASIAFTSSTTVMTGTTGTSLTHPSTSHVTNTIGNSRSVETSHTTQLTTLVDHSTGFPTTDNLTPEKQTTPFLPFTEGDLEPKKHKPTSHVPVIVGIGVVVVVVVVAYIITAVVLIKRRRNSTRNGVVLERSPVENSVYYTAAGDDVAVNRPRQPDPVTNDQQAPGGSQTCVNGAQQIKIVNPFRSGVNSHNQLDAKSRGHDCGSKLHSSGREDDPYEIPVVKSPNINSAGLETYDHLQDTSGKSSDLWTGEETYNHLQDTSGKSSVPWTGEETYNHLQDASGKSSVPWTGEGNYNHLQDASGKSSVPWTEEGNYNHLQDASGKSSVPWTGEGNYNHLQDASGKSSVPWTEEGNYNHFQDTSGKSNVPWTGEGTYNQLKDAVDRASGSRCVEETYNHLQDATDNNSGLQTDIGTYSNLQDVTTNISFSDTPKNTGAEETEDDVYVNTAPT
ncbi:uncharacterized protein LOC121390516 [Gigantopelta aegis]|uniref:uncharacterized protein LOC121390516 n=1 Tax=Gigantopelta aegis TaxID=1735272 RepID=UPI001B88E69E|nr:uncharacterized protein LOC121390516 [Gigantopelta aegis]